MAEIEEKIMDDALDILSSMYGEVPEIIQHIWHLIPIGQEITLSNGRVGRLKAFVLPSERNGRWEFGFDVVFDKGSPDHLEFFLKHTGGGGTLSEPVAIAGPISTGSVDQ